ncbi:polysaccharide deacetylase family protein [Aerosakkonema funiforme]|uniref:polysaccharide deacetylase family protein n=1 Tax=Aerosakkonema funiforme TaxID=1246630 RepID=UPI002AC84922|nr:polysaccharide deacetylase family protein [Aerosakkonema funiforme]
MYSNYQDYQDRVSIFELAQLGNTQAIAYWINSLLVPQGIYVRVQAARNGSLQIFVELPWLPQSQEDRQKLRDRLLRYICDRLGKLNSKYIKVIEIVASLVGYTDILWKQSVRLLTKANGGKLKNISKLSSRSEKHTDGINFKIFRSIFLCCLALASFIFIYKANNYEAANTPTTEPQSETLSTVDVSPTPVASPPPPQEEETKKLVFSAPEQFQGQIVHQVQPERNQKLIALTFDDGPWQNTTLQVLEILKKHNVKATFFWIGKHLKQYPQVAQKVVADGHAIGNHTFHHFTRKMNSSTAAREIDETEELISETTGVRTSLLRPPGGVLNNGVVTYAKKKKYAILMWSVDSRDYRVRQASKLAKNVLNSPNSGGIVLLHDGGGNRSATVQALPEIISTLKQRGYKFVTVPELLESAKKAKSQGNRG